MQIVYAWAYLVLAVDGARGEVRWEWTSTVRQEVMAAVVGVWREEGIDGIVWDGSGSHRARRVCAAAPITVRLPPYAPELNPAERVFQELRARIEGRTFPTLAAKCEATEMELRKIAADPERVRRLTGWTWIEENLASLPDLPA